MDRVAKFTILLISIAVGLAVGLVFAVFLAPLLAGGIFAWAITGAFIAFVMFLVRIFLGLWIIANDEDKELTESDKNFSIKQGKEID